MKNRYIILGISIFIITFLITHTGFSQIKEEKEEEALEALEVKKLSVELPSYKLSTKVALFSGYDSNVYLSPTRKGDIFQDFLYSLDFSKPWIENIKFTFDYDLDVLNYNEFTDISNILNHLRFGLHRKIAPFIIGTGYDLGIFYYPKNEDGDFLFHRGFFYVGQNILKNLYHQLEFESGIKDYTHRKALADAINTYQDKERLDRRMAIGYNVSSKINPRLLLLLKTKFSVNDSNARYMDFYDYKSYQGSFGLGYNLLKDLSLLLDFAYTRKDYDSRTVTLRDYEQKDNLYTATSGLKCRLNKRNSLYIYYTYRENSSNDGLAEYSESVITTGWQYNF